MPEKRSRPTSKDWIEYVAARMAATLFRVLPFSAASAVGRMIGWLFFKLDARHRERVCDQLHMAFGDEMSPAKALQTAREMYQHFGIMLAEFVRLPDVNETTIARYIDWGDSLATILPVMQEGKGAIFATGHISNWELCGIAGHAGGFSEGAVARPLDNPLFERYIRTIRRASGNQIWDKFGALRSMLRLLRAGKGVGILVDQDAGQRGLFVPFFGKTSSTIPTPAALSIRTGAPIFVVGVHRTDGVMRFRFKVRGPLRPDPNAEPETETLRLLTEINNALEEIIREKPAEWLWLHRRWKTQPKPQKDN